ncbi:MAG: hypothetical protein ACYC0H_22500, partial [Solirubrobacteraceae bacterium]
MSTASLSRRRRRATAVVAGISGLVLVGLAGTLRPGWSVAVAATPAPPDTTTTTAPPASTTTTAPPANTPPPGQSPTTTAPPPPTYTVNQPPATTTSTGGGGGGGGGGGSTSTTPTSATSPATVGAGGVVWSDAPGTKPTGSDPLVVAVGTPTGGSVTITKTSTNTPSSPSGYTALGQEVQISAPQASASQPLTLTFDLSTSVLPAGDLGGDVVVFRDGAPIQACASSPAT